MDMSFKMVGEDDHLIKPKESAINFQDIYEMSIELKGELDIISNELQLKTFTIYMEKQNLNKIIKIQRFLKSKSQRKDYFLKISKLIKNMRYRKNIVKELLLTEEVFIKNLSLIINNLMIPLKNNSLAIAEPLRNEILSSFSNIEPIKAFNEKLFNKLSFILKNYHHNAVFGNLMLEFLPFFKLYFVYCNEFEKNNILFKKIKTENNPEYKIVAQWLLTLEYTPALKKLDLNSMLVMPVQRLPKYVLLFKDLVKHTEEFHPDHKNLKNCLDKFIEINEENNKKMNLYLKNIKIFELQNVYGSPDFAILDPKREFLEEETLGLIMNNMNRAVICYFLSDLVLVTERSTEASNYKLLNHINLNDDSFIKDLPDTKYFSDLFSVNGVNICLTFSVENLDAKHKFFNLINGIINKLKEKKENKLNLLKKTTNLVSQELILSKVLTANTVPVKVNVIGTEERNYSTFGRYTVYIIEIKLNEFSQRIYLRYSEMIHLYNIVRKHFPHINTPKIIKNHWFTYRKTKIIESRKMLIENFLQNILKNEKVIYNGAKILSFLNLPLDLYEVHLNKIRMTSSNNLELSQSISNVYLLKKYTYKNNSNNILESDKIVESPQHYEDLEEIKSENETFSNRSSDTHRMTTPPLFLSEKKSSSFIFKNQRKTVHKLKEMSKIQTENFSKETKINFVDGSSTTIQITVNTTAEDAVEMISKLINLRNFLDFRLFLIDEYNNKKMIDEDELLFKFFCQENSFQKIKWEFDSQKIPNIYMTEKAARTKNKTIFHQMKKKISHYLSISQIFSKEKTLKLVFKKYFYLDQKLEKEDFLEDPVRAKLVAFQIFTDIENFKFQLRSHDYILLTALYIFINYGDFENYKGNDNFLKFLSTAPFLKRLKKYPSWIDHVSHTWEKISHDIEKISKKKFFVYQESRASNNQESLEKTLKSMKSSSSSPCNSISSLNRLSNSPKVRDSLVSFKTILACYTVIHIFENNEIYGAELFYVETYNHRATSLPKYMTLAVKFTGLSFLSLNDKKIIKKIKYSEISETISQPKSLLLKLKSEFYRFNTFKSFEICQIIEEYKKFREINNVKD